MTGPVAFHQEGNLISDYVTDFGEKLYSSCDQLSASSSDDDCTSHNTFRDKEGNSSCDLNKEDPISSDENFYLQEEVSYPKLCGLKVPRKYNIHDAADYGSIAEFAHQKTKDGSQKGSFLVCNLRQIVRQFYLWKKELPMVEPFYAIKCNPDPMIVRLLAHLGCGFDCATMGEIDIVINDLGDDLSFGRDPLAEKAANKIVYANPAKMESHLQFAADNNVRMTVFDGEDELLKISKIRGNENFRLLLRLTTDDSSSVCRFSTKFGCPVDESESLLQLAKDLGLNVAGVSFHVGSGCGNPDAYTVALAHSRIVFDTAEKLGMPAMTVVDIGGGFPGDKSGVVGGVNMPDFPLLASAVRKGISAFLADLDDEKASKIRFIAEPGRFFVSASVSIITKVYSRKGGKKDYQALYVDDGVYGSFNNVVYDHAKPIVEKLSSYATQVQKKRLAVAYGLKCSAEESEDTQIPSAVFGPTCDGLDQMCSLENTKLPRCEVGDWLMWEYQGAYTHTASYVFNGYSHVPKTIFCFL